MYGTYHFRDIDDVQERSQIVCEFLEGIIRDRPWLVRLAVSEHIRYDDTITGLNPWADLVPPTVPIRLLTGGPDTLSTSACHTRNLESRVPGVG